MEAGDEHLRLPRGRPRRRSPRGARSRPPRRRQVTEQLRQRGLIVLDVSEKREAFKLETVFQRFKSVDMRELAVFSRQFATLIASGMPMLRSLYTLEDQTEDEKLRGDRRRSARTSRPAARSPSAMERQPGRLRPALPLDGQGGGGLGPPRGGAGEGRRPAREARRAAPPDPLGDDVPGVRLRLRGRS